MVKKSEDTPKFRWGLAILIIIGLMFVSFVFAVIVAVFVGSDFESLTGDVALIEISGPIVGESDISLFASSVASSEDITKLIRKADEDSGIKAIVLKINSPGGSAVASDEIAQEVKKVSKPTVAWIREVGASGGYWIASSTDHIIANRMSITGSIGVIASYLGFSGLLEEHNVTYERLVAGRLKDTGSPFKEMTREERVLFQATLDELHNEFITVVANNRNMDKREVERIATGLFYTGKQAYELGLVDELGGRDEVESYLEKILETDEIDFVTFEIDRGFFGSFSASISDPFLYIGRGIGEAVMDHEPSQSVQIRT